MAKSFKDNLISLVYRNTIIRFCINKVFKCSHHGSDKHELSYNFFIIVYIQLECINTEKNRKINATFEHRAIRQIHISLYFHSKPTRLNKIMEYIKCFFNLNSYRNNTFT
jgi:hypothetical protein